MCTLYVCLNWGQVWPRRRLSTIRLSGASEELQAILKSGGAVSAYQILSSGRKGTHSRSSALSSGKAATAVDAANITVRRLAKCISEVETACVLQADKSTEGLSQDQLGWSPVVWTLLYRISDSA